MYQNGLKLVNSSNIGCTIKIMGKERWFREKIISYGNDGFFHQDYDCPVYYNRFSDLGKSVRLCDQKYDYNAACGIDN